MHIADDKWPVKKCSLAESLHHYFSQVFIQILPFHLAWFRLSGFLQGLHGVNKYILISLSLFLSVSLLNVDRFDRMPGLVNGSVVDNHDQAMTEALEQFCNSPEQTYEQFLSTFTNLTPGEHTERHIHLLSSDTSVNPSPVVFTVISHCREREGYAFDCS